MLTNQKIRVILMAALCGLIQAAAPAADAGISDASRDAISRESVSRQQLKAKADDWVRAGNEAFVKGQYKEAIAKYISAKQMIKNTKGDEFETARERCTSQIAKSYFYLAQDAVVLAQEKAQVSNYDEAIALCKQALEYYPECKESVLSKIGEYEKAREIAKVRAETSETTLIPNKTAQEYKIQVLLRQGQELVQAGLISQAIRKYQEVLLIDPYHSDALYNLRSCNVRNEQAADARYKLQHRKGINEMEWRWSTPILPEGVQEVANVIDSPFKRELAEREGLDKKINSIIIPDATFDEVSILTAVKKLQALSKEHDPEQRGVNIMYVEPPASEGAVTNEEGGMPAPPPGPAPAPAPVRAEGEEVAEETEEGDGETAQVATDNSPKVSLSVTNRSLDYALKLLAKTAKLQMRVERSCVILTPLNVALDKMETKFFPVEKSMFDDVDAENDKEGLKKYFTERGVLFPNGATVVYKPKISRLIVSNTLDNLQRIDKILQDIQSQKPAMVDISVKFIEVGEDDLKELGFDYTVSYNPSNKGYTNSTNVIPDNSNGRLSVGDSLTGMNRSQGMGPLFTVQGIAGGADGFAYAASIYASNQASSTDMLAAPRLMTLEGTTAYIEMVTERTFVDDYDEGELQQGSSSDNNTNYQTYTKIGPMPNFEDPTPLGIKLQIKPEVDRETRRIRIPMRPSVTSFVAFEEYRYTNSDGSEELLRKPIIAVREVDTQITIYDGETVVLGGVIDDIVTTYADKIPILGDLPLVGRFFQSRSTKAEKRNLLIFMTCRLVKPDGTPLFPSERVGRGVPDAGRLE